MRQIDRAAIAERANTRHYVYRLFDQDGRLIYIGCTYSPEARIKQHRTTMWWGDQITRVKITVHPNKPAAHAVELAAIHSDKPRWNINSKWVHNHSWTAQDFADYIKAHELSREHMTSARQDRINEAKRLMDLRREEELKAAA
jgi:predicted GIY-YIG superfamily endonuclease